MKDLKNFLTKYTAQNKFQLAIVYEHWLNGQIPVSWKQVAELSIDENLNAAGKTVSIYSIDEKGFITLQENIRNFNWNKNVKVDIKSKP